MRIADVLDVVVLAAFLYILLSLIRTSVSRSAATGLVVLAAIYVFARILNMYMVETVMRGLFVFALLAFAIVFQADLRRIVERLGLWASGRTGEDRGVDGTVDLLTEAASRLAERRTGALIALHGRESWERLVEGGVELNGRVSLPLLYSLFDPATPGHDGAVLLEGSRVARFGAHLPLSTHLGEIKMHGTRHTAALGLSERCDALVIVVSEEYGTISVAREGRLHRDVGASALASHIQAFDREKRRRDAPAKPHVTRRAVLTSLAGLVLSAGAWLLFVYQPGLAIRSYVVPVELRQIPPEWVVGDAEPDEVRITLEGNDAGFRLLNVQDLAVSLDLSDIHEGANTYTVEDRQLNLPQNLGLYRAEPAEIVIDAERRAPTNTQAAPDSTTAAP